MKLLIILLIAAGVLVYANTLGNGMFWDDNDFVLNNAYVKDWQYLGKYFSENLIAGARVLSNYWRPALLFIFSLQYHLWQDWAPGFHFVNMAFHIADGILLFFILVRLFDRKWLAFLTSLIFLIHPLQTEAVSYVSSLGDSLSVFFMFAGILLYLKARRFWTGVFYVLALMSKETAVIMPALILLIEIVGAMTPSLSPPHEGDPPDGRAGSKWGSQVLQIIKKTWPYFAIAAIYIVLRATNLNFVNTFNLYNEDNIFTESLLVRLLTFFRILTVYFGLLFWPATLHMERSVEIATAFNSPGVILGGVILVGLLTLAIIRFKKWPVVSFGIFWFFIALAPTSNLIVPINGLLYEHWLYVPLIGIFIIPLSFLPLNKGPLRPSESEAREMTCPPKPWRSWKRGLSILLIIYLGFFSVRSIARNNEWRDPIRFYNQTLGHAPQSYRVINNLGMEYANLGRLDEAIQTYQRAISLDPEVPVAYHNLGNTYKALDRLELAIANFEKAIELDPKFAYSYNALAKLYLEQGEQQKAQEILERYTKVISPP